MHQDDGEAVIAQRPDTGPPAKPHASAGAGAGAPDEILGRFRSVRELGRGGMGRVLEAYDPELRRRVAVKVTIDPALPDSEAFGRFLRETHITAQLEHPSIVPVHDLGRTDDGRLYFVMKKVEGHLLSEVLDTLYEGDAVTRQEWPRHRLLGAFVQVCNAIAYAHDRKVLHRDLKPENIMLGPFGEVLIMDWGVAARMGGPHDDRRDDRGDPAGRGRPAHPTDPPGEMQPITQDGWLVGTPGYISPEQARGERRALSAQSDVWSLGAILYEMLTYRHAYRGPNAAGVLVESLAGPPRAPRSVAPDLHIPEEMAEVCMRALAPNPADRYHSAAELAGAVEAFLAGKRRREQAHVRVLEADRRWLDYLVLVEEREQLRGEEQVLADRLDAWSPLTERADLHRVRDRLADLELRLVRTFGETIGLSEKALAHDPANPEARAVLANAHFHRLQDAETRRDATEAAYCEDRVRAFDDGRYAALLEGTGALSLRTDPAGAQVLCQRFERRGLVWPLGEPTPLGRTPLDRVSLPMGSYVITLRAAGRRDTLYPIHIARGQEWQSGPGPIPLFADADVPRGFVYVPPGPFVCGGDVQAPGSMPRGTPFVGAHFMGVYQVTMEEYLGFINELHDRDPDEAWRRVPRSESSLSHSAGQYWTRPAAGGRYVLPEHDWDDEPWETAWPAFGVSWDDARAYAAWISHRLGGRYDLPSEYEFEKAARGVDGRFYPWGDGFDRTLCKMGDSRRSRARPEPIGAFPTDISVYGVRDLAGSMRDWCSDASFDGDPSLRPVRGGSWNYDPRFCRAACRLGRPPWRVFAYNGFRLVCRPAGAPNR